MVNFKLIFVLLGWDGMDEMGNVKNLSVFFVAFLLSEVSLYLQVLTSYKHTH